MYCRWVGTCNSLHFPSKISNAVTVTTACISRLKYQTLSLSHKISNAVTAGLWCRWFGTCNSRHIPSNVAQYYYETTTSLPCLNGACAMTWNNSHFWALYIDIASNARVSEFLPLAVPTTMQAKQSDVCTLPRSCRAVLHYFSSWREDTVSNRDRFVLQFRSKFYLLFTSTRLTPNQISSAFFSVTRSNASSFQLKAIFVRGISHN